MGNPVWDVTLFLSALSCLLAGVILPMVFLRHGRMANAAASVCGAVGGALGMVCGGSVLLAHSEVTLHLWSVTAGLPLILHVDVLGAFFLMLISAVSVAAAFYSYGYNKGYYGQKNVAYLGALINLFALSMMAVVTASSAFSFLIAWELMSIVSFMLVMFEYEKPEVRSAGYLYAAMTHIGTVFLTISFLLFYFYTGSISFDAFRADAAGMPMDVKSAIFVMCLIGFGTKAGLLPLHIWLPRAHPAAPSNVSALMSAVMLKTAAYGMFRVCFDFLGYGEMWWGFVLILVGVLSAVGGILFALNENDMKRFLAFSSAENMGIIFAAMGAGLLFQTQGWNFLAAVAIMAMMLHSISHALFKGLLFFGAGAVLHATHTKDINELGGLIRRMPRTAVLFLVGGMSMAALPPMSGFISEWAVLQSMLRLGFDSATIWVQITGCLAAAALALAGGMALMAVVKQFGVAFLAMPRSEKAEHAHECSLWMQFGMVLLVIPMLAFGLFPQAALSFISGITCKYFFTAVWSDMVLYVPFVEAETVSASMATGSLILILAAVLAGLRLAVGKGKLRYSPTWNCGTTLTSRMGFNGTSASHSMLKVFRAVSHLTDEAVVTKRHASNPLRMAVGAKADLGAEDKLYRPVVRLTMKLSQYVKRIQDGDLQAYLAYMVCALILALLGLFS